MSECCCLLSQSSKFWRRNPLPSSQRMYIGGAFSLIGNFKNTYLKGKKIFVLRFGFKHGKMDKETWNSWKNFGDNNMRRKYIFVWFSLVRLWGTPIGYCEYSRSPLHMPVKIVPKYLLVKRWKLKCDWSLLSTLRYKFATDAANRRQTLRATRKDFAQRSTLLGTILNTLLLQCLMPPPRKV